MNQSQTKTKRRLTLGAVALVALIVLLIVNLLVGLLPWSVQGFSIGRQNVFEISAPTKLALSSLEEDVCIYMVTLDGDFGVDRDILSMLKGYEDIGTHVSTKVISHRANPDFLNSRGYSLPDSGVAFVVESARRSRCIPFEDVYYYNCTYSMGGEQYTMRFSELEFLAYGKKLIGTGGTVEPCLGLEEALTNAVSFAVMKDVPTVAVFKNDTVVEVDAAFLRLLAEQNYEICTVGSMADLDAKKHDLLLLNTPLLDVDTDEAAALSAYLAAGGDLFLTTLYRRNAHPNLASVLAEFGLSADEQGVRLVENDKNYSISYGSTNYMLAKISSLHEATADFDGTLLLTDAHAIKIEEKQGVSTTPWLYTTENGSRERVDSSTGKATAIEEAQNTYTFGAIAERGESRVIWVSSYYVLVRDLDILNSGSNYDLMTEALRWCTDADENAGRIEIEPKVIRTSYLYVTWTALIVWSIILIGIIPLIVVTVGLVRRYLRRRGR